MKILYSLLLLCFISNISVAENVITDIPKSDPYYSSVENVEDKGYMSIFGNQFYGDRTITRKELAIVVDRINTRLESSNPFSKSDVQELTNLSQKFKTYLAENETESNTSKDSVSKILGQQKVLNHDLSQINAELRSELSVVKQEQETQKLYTWIGIGAVGLLSLIAN